jgi:hypothetical protein
MCSIRMSTLAANRAVARLRLTSGSRVEDRCYEGIGRQSLCERLNQTRRNPTSFPPVVAQTVGRCGGRSAFGANCSCGQSLDFL